MTGVPGRSPVVVDVIWAEPHDHPALESLLGPEEHQRALALRVPADRQRFISAHALLRLILGERVGIAAGELRFSRTCRTCGGPHGKPEVVCAGDAPRVSLSYAGRRVMVALTSSAEVGSDVEELVKLDFAGFASIALTSSEAEELQRIPAVDRLAAKALWWARKEAVLKASGHGLMVEPSAIAVSAPGQPPRLLEWDDADVERPEVRLADVEVGPDHAAAVAVIGDRDVVVRVSDGGALLR